MEESKMQGLSKEAQESLDRFINFIDSSESATTVSLGSSGEAYIASSSLYRTGNILSSRPVRPIRNMKLVTTEKKVRFHEKSKSLIDKIREIRRNRIIKIDNNLEGIMNSKRDKKRADAKLRTDVKLKTDSKLTNNIKLRTNSNKKNVSIVNRIRPKPQYGLESSKPQNMTISDILGSQTTLSINPQNGVGAITQSGIAIGTKDVLLDNPWKKVQGVEQTNAKVNMKKNSKAWNTFKVMLATILLGGSLAVSGYAVSQMKEHVDEISSRYDVPSIFNLNEIEQNKAKNVAAFFAMGVQEKDGYTFKSLSNVELAEGYAKLLDREKFMQPSLFTNAPNALKDQELLDEIVLKTFGEDVYQNFTDGQKRDYKQLAFEIIPIALPKIFEEDKTLMVRNPIVYDELLARNSALERGYEIKLVVNNDKKETVKNIGKLLGVTHGLTENNFSNTTDEDRGQTHLTEIVKNVLGDESYGELTNREKRDYLQLAYEFLPEELKGKIVADPIEIDKEKGIDRLRDNWREIGD